VTFSSWWRRVIAMLVDLLIVALIGHVLVVILGVHPYVFGRQRLSAPATIAQYTTTLLAAVLYYPLIMRRTDGQTVGKMLLGIRVARTDRRLMSLARASWREVFLKSSLLDALYLLPTVGLIIGGTLVALDYLWPLWDRENRALHDVLARTRVIRIVESKGCQANGSEKDVGGSGLAVEG
jgi:uncharacterized RDD family membrane protein YckC